MSRRVCTDWETFIDKLEDSVGKNSEADRTGNSRDELIRRANSAVRELKASAAGVFERAILNALVSGEDVSVPTQTTALARLWWPLVLTTNYDNCYEAAVRAQFKGDSPHQLAVVGRGIEDCQRVLNSLSVAGRSLLWALQGYLAAPHQIHYPPHLPPVGDFAKLRQQLVVGHEEYRRVTYRDLHFRRAFAEVFRQRSLLFLGSGIQETYLQELFGEVLENYGPTMRPHYAFIQENEVDAGFMLARFQIVVIEYNTGHGTVEAWLNRLADEASRPRRTPIMWSWGRIEPEGDSHWNSTPDLEVIRGPLPKTREEGECLAVDAHGDAAFQFSPEILPVLQAWGVQNDEQPQGSASRYLGVFPEHHVYAVRAWSDQDERSLSNVYVGALALFNGVSEGYRCIRMQLLAVGGPDRYQGTSEKIRTYPERFSFVQIVRAWAAWRDQNPTIARRLALHVTLDSVYQDIASGRIDVLELLGCKDIRFFVEILTDTGELERRLFQEMPDKTLDSVVHELGLSADYWELTVTPPRTYQDEQALSKLLSLSLQELGIVPGSTLHFRRPKS
jgi:hypothetical protein